MTRSLPMPNSSTDTAATDFYAPSVAQFGALNRLTSDQDAQFESFLFKALTNFTTSYHPEENGQVECLYRDLKSAIKAYAINSWVMVLPTILMSF